MKLKALALIFFSLTLLLSCDLYKNEQSTPPQATEFRPISQINQAHMIKGQLVYVPIYSHLPYSEKGHIPLNAILSVRNTSAKESIIISKVDYYDTNGKLLKSFVTGPFSLGKMATIDFTIPSHDLTGGTGANFVVQWDSPVLVSTPIIEAVMYGTLGTNSFTFSSRGQEIEFH